ncbi:mRNA guanylyltransferase Ceg1 [Schizosaccharomyces japonicus yFS275]|uniref:mRNA-capping enzyme subunit alpha n=1 Tax=Schizosaccharomyces japonicus (strain yFS275 / FY16936) TaxID=402676 RepID=B6JYQ9_SCHJY|nr:mRNA guanylyltransferase Ceg1 [Schizosaccharomyces japonicus yFS275]EEB06677.1 mRNA guanylyltransferase Ceg1 [Schizosaccharomyces japonicus yFS275]
MELTPPAIIPGSKIPHKDANILRERVSRLLGLRSLNFPGAQPVSFAKKHLQTVKEHDYYVCEKSDGIRCLMYMTMHHATPKRYAVYLIDRKNDYYLVPKVWFPTTNDPNDSRLHTETLIDGELVMDSIQGKSQLKFLVFDCLACNGRLYTNRPLDRRLGVYREFVEKPLRTLVKAKPKVLAVMPFHVEFKLMQRAHGIEMMFREIIPKLHHGSDGLIFTCIETPYVTGTDETLLKWKSRESNTVDFLLELRFTAKLDTGDIDYSAMPEMPLSIWEGGKRYSYFADLYLENEEWEKLKESNTPLQGRIVECYLDEQNRWRFMRFRDDKQNGNHRSTVRSVIESIEDGVTKEELLHEAYYIRKSYYERKERREARHHDNPETHSVREASKEPAASGAEKRKLTPESEESTKRARAAD